VVKCGAIDFPDEIHRALGVTPFATRPPVKLPAAPPERAARVTGRPRQRRASRHVTDRARAGTISQWAPQGRPVPGIRRRCRMTSRTNAREGLVTRSSLRSAICGLLGGGIGVACVNQSLCRLSSVTVQDSAGDGVSVGVRSHAGIQSTSSRTPVARACPSAVGRATSAT
jgi:hypothetical protein